MTSVNVYCVDDDGSSRYRLRWPAEAMAVQGMDVKLCQTGIVERDADVVVMNRPVREAQAQCVEELVALGKRVIIDMDDAYQYLIPQHVSYNSGVDEHLERACKAATSVVCSTPGVEDLYGYGHGVVRRNYIPEWLLSIEPGVKHETPFVMWTGSVPTHPTDLEVTRGNVAKAMGERRAELAYIGPKKQGRFVSFQLKWKGPTQLTGWFEDQKLLYEAMASATVGIVPLADNLFNAGKSHLKMLEFAAVGVPVVGSASVENKWIHDRGVGLIAPHARDWYWHVTNLLSDQTLREDVIGRGKEAARKLTLEFNVEELRSAWGVD